MTASSRRDIGIGALSLDLPPESALIAIRFIFSVLVAAGLSELIWKREGRHLSVVTNVVGSTTFNDFDINRYLDGYHLIAVGFPALAIAVYAVVARFGPIRRRAPLERPWPPPLLVDDAADPAEVTYPLLGFSEAARVLVPAAAIAIEVGLGASEGRRVFTAWAVLAGLAYVLLVVGVATGRAFSMRARGDRRPVGRLIKVHVPRTNLYCSLLALAGLAYASDRTTLVIASTGAVHHYHWFPVPVAVVAMFATAAACAWYLRSVHSIRAIRSVERQVLSYGIGSMLVVVLTTHLPDAMGRFQAFDDAHALVGAQLTFGHGFFPFRDLDLLHGVLADDLYGQLGIWLYGNDRWAAQAAQTLLIYPVSAVLLYVFAVYFSGRNRLVTAGILVAICVGLIAPLATRFAFLPALIMIFDKVLRDRGWIWPAVFMFVLGAECIITPETALMAAGLLGTLLVSDLVHFQRGQGFHLSGWRTARCLVWGAPFLLLWVIYLAVNGAVGTFLDYYLTAAPGHQYEGSFPAKWKIADNWLVDVRFFLPVVLLLMTILVATVRIRRRVAWTSHDWTMVACAAFVLLYFSKALDRLDIGHVDEVFAVAVPLIILWAIQVVRWLDRLLRRGANQAPGRVSHRRAGRLSAARIGFPATLMGFFLLVAMQPSQVRALVTPHDPLFTVAPEPPPASLPRLGYSVPGSTDIRQIDALRQVLDTYTSPRAPIYDLSGEAGVLYYLLDRVPASRFYVTQIVQTPYAQRIVVNDLRRVRPAIVVFNNLVFGLANYDRITTMERDYNISQYVLDHYRPLVDVDGQLLMIRDDLAASAPPLPALDVPFTTADLYNDMPACNWGDVPNFFAVPGAVPRGTSISLPVSTEAPQVHVSASGTRTTTELSTISIPPGVDLASYQWVEFNPAGVPLGAEWLSLSDVPAVGGPHSIDFATLARIRRNFYVQAGSCIQWHGYTARTLYLSAEGKTPVLPKTVTLVRVP
jgi:hypothetical protein